MLKSTYVDEVLLVSEEENRDFLKIGVRQEPLELVLRNKVRGGQHGLGQEQRAPRSFLSWVALAETHLYDAHPELIGGVDHEHHRFGVLVVLFPQTAVLVRSRHVEHVEPQASLLELLHVKPNRWHRRSLLGVRFQPEGVAKSEEFEFSTFGSA